MPQLFDSPPENARTERKYFISLSEAAALRERLGAVMHRDPHADENRRYLVTSVYFDTPTDRSLWASEGGIKCRKKYRIRAYNHSDAFICLECKEKRGDRSRKLQQPLTRADCDALMQGDPTPLLAYDSELARRFYADMRTGLYRPRAVVEYTREVFLYPVQKVRITLDTCLRGANRAGSLFSPPPLSPLLPPTVVLLEVKYSHCLPDFIRALLPTDVMPATANCKYARSRAI